MMAGSQNRRDLYLSVSGDVSNLQTSMKAGRTALLDLTRAANDTQSELQAAFRNISADPSALKGLVASYDATFRTIRQNAQAVLAAPDKASALNIINSNGAQQQAAAAEAQATQLRIAADAALLVAERQGEAGVAARVLAAAFDVQADDAQKVAGALRVQAGVLAEVAAEAKVAGAREDELGGSHKRMGSSGLIAEHVVRSLSDSIAAGQSPVRALTVEMGRITEAMTLYAQSVDGNAKGATAKFAAFMGGPWGIAISAAVAVLTPLVAELFEAKDAADLAKIGADGLSDAQGTLGKVFDLTSGKLEHQNELLRLNSRLTAVNLRADAAKEGASSAHVFGSAGGGLVPNVPGLGALGTLAEIFGANGSSAVQKLALHARVANRISNEGDRTKALDAILQTSEHTDFKGSGIGREAFQQAIIDAASSRAKTAVAGEIDKSLNSGVLDKGLRNDPKGRAGRKPRADHTAEREANADRAYQTELGTAQDRLAKANLALADTAENRLTVELDKLTAAAAQRDLEIGDQVDAKKITDAEAERLYDLNADALALEKQAAVRQEQQALLDRQLSADQRILDRKLALLQLQSGAAIGTRAQRALALQQLEAEEDGRRLSASRKLKSDNADTRAEGKSDLEAVGEQHAGRVAAINREHADPLQKFKLDLQQSAGDMNDALKSVEADGLKGLEDGLLGVISGTESASDAFKKMALSIVADLEKILIEKALLSAIGGIFPGFSDGGAVSVKGFATGGVITGPGSGTSDSILARLSNGEFVMPAAAVKKHLPLLEALRAGTLPGFADGGFVGGLAIPNSYRALPKSDELRSHQQVTVHTVTEVQPSPLFDVRSRSIAQQTVGQAAQPIMSGATSQTMKKLNRRALPGGYA